MKLENRTEFLYKAIDDARSTIRAVDRKISAVMIVLAIPLTKLGAISIILGELFQKGFWPLSLIFICSYCLAIWFGYSALVSRYSPKQHVDSGTENPTGLFFFPYSPSFSLIDCLFSPPVEKQIKKSLSDLMQEIKDLSEDQLIRELSFDFLKLVFIRDLKITAQNYCYICTVFAAGSGIVNWISHLTIS